jgi:hypothetical protein
MSLILLLLLLPLQSLFSFSLQGPVAQVDTDVLSLRGAPNLDAEKISRMLNGEELLVLSVSEDLLITSELIPYELTFPYDISLPDGHTDLSLSPDGSGP